MKSLLYQSGETPFEAPPGCEIGVRNEVPVSLRKDGRLYRFVVRDKIVAEDPYIVAVKATAFALQQGEPYSGTPTPRNVRDFLIKLDTVV